MVRCARPLRAFWTWRATTTAHTAHCWCAWVGVGCQGSEGGRACGEGCDDGSYSPLLVRLGRAG